MAENYKIDMLIFGAKIQKLTNLAFLAILIKMRLFWPNFHTQRR